MKLLVTGDWHVGARTWGLDRTPEVTRALSILLDRARTWRPDGVVILGDVFDRFRYPGDEAAELVAATFREFLDLPGGPEVVFVRGNHDWAGVRIWQLLEGEGRLRVVDRIERRSLGGFDLLLVPYLRPHQIPRGSTLESLIRGAWDGVPAAGLPLCLGHLALTGTVPGIRELTLDPDLLAGMGLTSVICGHIHRHGQVPDLPLPSFYSGPLFPVDFAEEGQKIGALLVEDGTVRSLPLPARRLKTLTFRDQEAALGELEQCLAPLAEDTLVRVSLDDSDLSRTVLLDRFRGIPGGERVVQVRTGDRIVTENVPQADPALDIRSLWMRYVEAEEPEGPRRDLLTRTGLSLLAGEGPEEAWAEIRHRVQEGRQS